MTSRQLRPERDWRIRAATPETTGAAAEVPPNLAVYRLKLSVVKMPGASSLEGAHTHRLEPHSEYHDLWPRALTAQTAVTP